MARLSWNAKFLSLPRLSFRYLHSGRSLRIADSDAVSPVPKRSVCVEMIPPWMRAYLFGSYVEQVPLNISLQRVTSECDPNGRPAHLPESKFDLPKIVGGSLDTHFQAIGDKQMRHYLSLLWKLTKNIPLQPERWIMQPGWTKYSSKNDPTRVEFPHDDALILDVEVCVSEGCAPTIATAVGSDAWYSWVSPSVIQGSGPNWDQCSVKDLIPIRKGESRPRIIVGHNVCYDSARIKNSYDITDLGLRYFDTMSAHICLNGVTSLQKFFLRSSPEAKSTWMSLSSSNSLSNVHKFYCGHYLDKSGRNVFVEGSLSDIADSFQELVMYCADDVIATHAVFCKQLPLFLERFPHPITLAGLLEMSCMYLPLDAKWTEKLQDTEVCLKEDEEELLQLLQQIADETCYLSNDEKFKEDPWMWDQDWSVKRVIKKKPFTEEDCEPPKTCAGYPQWYRKLFSEMKGITPLMKITPKLLQLCWHSYPLHMIRGYGWGMVIPASTMESQSFSELKEEISVNVPLEQLQEICFESRTEDESCNPFPAFRDLAESVENTISYVIDSKREDFETVTEVSLGKGVIFRKLPHIRGFGRNVGTPFSKDLIMNPALRSNNKKGQRVLVLLRRKQFWLRFRDKLKFIPLVWHDKLCNTGAFHPQTIVCGDFKRYPKESVFSNLIIEDKNSIGSQLCEALVAPSDWIFLSAQVPEADMWMASILSDGVFGKYGSTPLGKMFLENSLFDHIAEFMDVDVSHARLLSYAVLFGAQRGFLARMIRKTNLNLSQYQALGLADRLTDKLLGECKRTEASPYELCWQNGIQSELWNKLENMALKAPIKTPILESSISQALESEQMKFLRLAASWIVQSSKVDFLHLLVVSFRHLVPSARLSIIMPHEHLVFLVPIEHQYHAAKSLHFSHLYAKAFCASRVGFTDMPQSSAFLPKVQLHRCISGREDSSVQTLTVYDAIRLTKSVELRK